MWGTVATRIRTLSLWVWVWVPQLGILKVLVNTLMWVCECMCVCIRWRSHWVFALTHRAARRVLGRPLNLITSIGLALSLSLSLYICYGYGIWYMVPYSIYNVCVFIFYSYLFLTYCCYTLSPRFVFASFRFRFRFRFCSCFVQRSLNCALSAKRVARVGGREVRGGGGRQ